MTGPASLSHPCLLCPGQSPPTSLLQATPLGPGLLSWQTQNAVTQHLSLQQPDFPIVEVRKLRLHRQPEYLRCRWPHCTGTGPHPGLWCWVTWHLSHWRGLSGSSLTSCFFCISPGFYFVLVFVVEAFKIISIQLCIMLAHEYLDIFRICDYLVDVS